VPGPPRARLCAPERPQVERAQVHGPSGRGPAEGVEVSAGGRAIAHHLFQVALRDYLRRLEDVDLADPLLRIELETDRAVLAWHAHRGREAVTLATAAAELAQCYGALQLAEHVLSQTVYSARGSRTGHSTPCGVSSRCTATIRRSSKIAIGAISTPGVAESDDLGDARRRIRHARRLAASNGAPFPEALCALLEARIAHVQGDAEATRDAPSRGLTIGRRMPSEQLLYMAGWLRADRALQAGDRSAARRILGETLARGRRHGLLFFAGCHAPLVRRGCERALEEGIETGFARTLLRLDGARDDALHA